MDWVKLRLTPLFNSYHACIVEYNEREREIAYLHLTDTYLLVLLILTPQETDCFAKAVVDLVRLLYPNCACISIWSGQDSS